MKYLILALPALISLCVPLYNIIEPRLFGFPFFYWFLLILIPLSGLATLLVYLSDRR